MDQLDSIKKATILVVDDVPDNLALISNLFKNDYQVKVANGGEKALKIAASGSPPDLILLDIMMPGMDGYEVCRQLKHASKTMNIPVIFLTAKADEEDEQKGLELGAVDYIVKPISPPIVKARVKNHLALKAMTDFLRDQNDWDAAERLANTLRGVSGNVGVTGLQQFADKLEIAIKERRSRDDGDASGDVQTLVTQLARQMPEEPGKKITTVDPGKLQAVCGKLELLLIADDVAACDILDANAELLDSAFPNHSRKIDNSIRSFDFEAALAALRAAIRTTAQEERNEHL